MKAIRSLEIGAYGLTRKRMNEVSDVRLEEGLAVPTDERLFFIAEAFRRGMMVEEIHALSHIDPWFLHKIRRLVTMETRLRLAARTIAALADTFDSNDPAAHLLRDAKRMGFTDRQIAECAGLTERDVRGVRNGLKFLPVYKTVDTCAAEFEAATPYFYSCYEEEDECVSVPRENESGAES